MSLDQWQVVVAPAGNTAGEFGGLEAGLLQLGTETTGMLAKGIDLSELVNDLLKRDIALIQAVAG